LRQFERAEQAVGRRRLAGIRDHSIWVRVGGLCTTTTTTTTTTTAFVVVVVVSRGGV